jgi:hypothetical protein
MSAAWKWVLSTVEKVGMLKREVSRRAKIAAHFDEPASPPTP